MQRLAPEAAPTHTLRGYCVLNIDDEAVLAIVHLSLA
jgi:hypothetical protein